MISLAFSGKSCAFIQQTDSVGKVRLNLENRGVNMLYLPLNDTKLYSEADVLNEVFEEMAWYEWVVFTSEASVLHFFDLFFKRFKDIRCLGPMRIACYDESVTRILNEYHLEVDIISPEPTSESLGEALVKTGSLDNTKLLVVSKKDSSSELMKFLGNNMAIVDQLSVYGDFDFSKVPSIKEFVKRGADVVLFSSVADVEAFIKEAAVLKLSANAKRPAFCSLTDETSKFMRSKGLPVDIEGIDVDQVVEKVLAQLMDTPKR